MGHSKPTVQIKRMPSFDTVAEKAVDETLLGFASGMACTMEGYRTYK